MYEIIHGGIKKFTEVVELLTEVSNNSRRGLNNSRRYELIHGAGQMVYGGMQ